MSPVNGYSVVRVMRTLEALAEGPITTEGLADRLQINVRTGRRTLRTLVVSGYVERGPAPRFGYAATDKLRVLGERLAASPGHQS